VAFTTSGSSLPPKSAPDVLGWSQTDLGERTGVTQRAIYRIEDGATRPRQLTWRVVRTKLCSNNPCTTVKKR
jgi:predicted transcriptional regulator